MEIDNSNKLAGDVPKRVTTKGYNSSDAALVTEGVVHRAINQIRGKPLEVKVYGTTIELSVGERKNTT